MSLSPIAAASTQLLDLLTGSTGASSTATTPPLDSLSTSTPSGTVDLSDAAQTLAKLQNLSETDPAKFKQLTAQISSELQTAAQSSSGSQASSLTALSNDFKTASQTGSVASLEPQSQSGGHHGHHHGGHAPTAYSANATSTTASSPDSVLQTIFQQVASA